MKIKTLQTSDFMGLPGTRKYDFSTQVTAFCEGNAKGKTSVLNAVRYGLTGVKPDGEIVTKGKDKAAVQVEFEDGTSFARVEFSKQGKPAAYWVDKKRSTLTAINQKITGMTGNSAGIPKILAASDLLRRLSPQEFGELLLGYLPETMTTDDVLARVTGLTEPMKATIIENLPEGEFGTKELDSFHAKCVERRRELKSRIKGEKAFIEGYSRFPVPQETMQQLEDSIKALEGQHDRAVAYAAAKREYDKLKKQADDHIRLIKDVEAKIGTAEPVSHTDEERKAAVVVLEAHRTTVTNLHSSLQAMKSSADALKKAIDGIRKPVCPLSDRLVCTTDKTIILNDLVAEYNSLAAEYKKQQASYRTAKAKAENAEKEIQKIDADNAEAKRVAGLKDNLKRLRETMPAVPEEPKPAGDAGQIKQQVNMLRQKVRYLQDAEKLGKYRASLEKHEEMLAKYEKLADAFSPKGEVKKAVTKYYIDEFSASCNRMAGKLFPGMNLKFIPEDGVTVLVDSKGKGDYISIESLSGSEKACVTFLLMSLLSKISGFRILVLDELSVLDNNTLSALLDLLEEHKDEYDLAILALVNHEDSTRILAEKGIRVLEA